MLGRILAGVLVPVMVAASGYGGFVGMTKLIEEVETPPSDETAWSPNSSYLATNGQMQITLPFAYTTEVLQETVDGVVIEGTMFTTPGDLAEGYAVVVIDFGELAVGVDPQTLLQSWMSTSAGEGKTLVGDEPFVLGVDPARRARLHSADGDVYLTAVLHGTVGVSVIGATDDGDTAPADYATVVASLQFFPG
jgi:hypothetical protein